jgi:fructose-1-phosphate kinase PfkB-like protein
MSDEDITSITGINIEDLWVEYLSKNNVSYYLITRGGASAIAYYNEEVRNIEVPKVKVQSTVGAGDATSAGILSCGPGFLKTNNDFFSALEKGIRFGSHVCTLNENFIESNFKIR